MFRKTPAPLTESNWLESLKKYHYTKSSIINRNKDRLDLVSERTGAKCQLAKWLLRELAKIKWTDSSDSEHVCQILVAATKVDALIQDSTTADFGMKPQELANHLRNIPLRCNDFLKNIQESNTVLPAELKLGFYNTETYKICSQLYTFAKSKNVVTLSLTK